MVTYFYRVERALRRAFKCAPERPLYPAHWELEDAILHYEMKYLVVLFTVRHLRQSRRPGDWTFLPRHDGGPANVGQTILSAPQAASTGHLGREMKAMTLYRGPILQLAVSGQTCRAKL